MVLVSLLTDITSRREGADGDWLADVRSWHEPNQPGRSVDVR